MTKLYVPVGPVDGKLLLNREYRKRLTKVMRLKIGDELQVGSQGKQYICKIETIQPESIVLQVIRELPVENPKLRITLGQSIMKGDRFEWLIEKATELGVAEIYPLITERTIVRPNHPEEKMQRWNDIAEQAAGQSENSHPVLVHSIRALSSFLMLSSGSGLKLVLHETEGATALREVLQSYDGNHIMVIVGPEGGWTEEESQHMEASGFTKIHVGPRIMRAETAGLVIAALLQYELGDLRSAGHAHSAHETSRDKINPHSVSNGNGVS